MWHKLSDKKPKDGQKILVLIWGTEVFPATALYSESKEIVFFPETDCIDCESDFNTRQTVYSPKFAGDVSHWMSMPKLPKE